MGTRGMRQAKEYKTVTRGMKQVPGRHKVYETFMRG